MTDLLPALSCLHPSAIGGDSESFAIGERAMQAPPTVCLQWGDTTGRHEVEPTKNLRDAIAWMFSRAHEQIWFHNAGYDISCFLEWYPELSDTIWGAMQDGRLFDTLYLQRMIQIARGDIGGPLGLDKVALQYGIRPPTKDTRAEHPDRPGTFLDVRTSFGLWYGAESIPDPWFSYADYDGEVMLPLAARMVESFCTPKPGQKYPLVRLEDLAQTTRTFVGHALWRTYGLRVNQKAVSNLAVAGKAALVRLQDTAQLNGFLKPKFANRKQVAAGLGGRMVCPVQYESRPPKDPAGAAWDRRAAKHKGCPGCKQQLLDADGVPQWSKNTKALKAAVTLAYEGNPPLTEKKKDKKTGKMRGGGQIATSRHVLQDSQNHELEAWSQYNEYVALMSKDMTIFARGVVHTRIGMANTTRITSSDPNCLNFRRTSFFFANCPTCDYELSVDPDTSTKVGKGKIVLHCPVCEPNK
jgi:hypothetical protein